MTAIGIFRVQGWFLIPAVASMKNPGRQGVYGAFQELVNTI